MSLREDNIRADIVRRMNEEAQSLAVQQHKDRELAEYLRNYEVYPRADKICPYCNEPISDGDEVVGLKDNSLAHWDCWNEANGNIL